MFVSLLRIELIVDHRVNRSSLSSNGIRNAVSLQPVLYVGGIPNNNFINLTDSGLNGNGFQGCLASFIIDGRLLDYQLALVQHGKMKMNVCSGKFLATIGFVSSFPFCHTELMFRLNINLGNSNESILTDPEGKWMLFVVPIE